jgi:hypothetical protein
LWIRCLRNDGLVVERVRCLALHARSLTRLNGAAFGDDYPSFLLLWGPLRRIFRPSEPSSQLTESVDDPFTRKRGPKGLAGAVALEAPDEDAPGRLFPVALELYPRILSVYIPLVK